MAVKGTYVVREAGQNLWRNALMTITAIITVGISLTLAGAAFLLRDGVDNAFAKLRSGFSFTVYMNPTAPAEQITAVESQLKATPQVKSYKFVNQTEAYAEVKTIFRNSPDELVAFKSEKDVPSSFRVKPREPKDITVLASKFSKLAGVYKAADLADGTKSLLRLLRNIEFVILIVAVVLLVAAVLHILNTIRMAIFARRREVAVMKLVGATNWFIRLPFMLEGMLQGVLGALLAIVVVLTGNSWVQGNIRHAKASLFKDFSVASGQSVSIGILILVVGAIAGALGSAVAVSRFLDV